MLLQSFLSFSALILLAHSKPQPLPKGTCVTRSDSGSLFCDGPSSIPNRYVIKFKSSATQDQILTHLKSTNSSFKGADCGFGASAQSIAVSLSSPEERSGAVAQCASGDCEFKKHYWKETEGSKDPGKCGFNYIYDSSIGGIQFTGYAAAMTADALANVLADPIVFIPPLPFGLCLIVLNSGRYSFHRQGALR
jgi:hypothetical protein